MSKLHLQDIDLYYEDIGQGAPLLLIHGLGSSSQDWALQLPELSKHFRVITYDVRGHGRSGKPPGPYSVSLFAADAAELLENLGTGPAHVVGISMGGMIAFQLAVNYAQLVKSLVIVNSGPELVIRTLGERIQLFQRMFIVRLLGMRRMGEFLSQRLLPKPEHAELRKEFVRRWAENDPRAYRQAMQALIGWSVTDQIKNIHCPTLVIAADQDYTPVSIKEAYITRMPYARLHVIHDARHALPVERPEEFNQILFEFLSRQS